MRGVGWCCDQIAKQPVRKDFQTSEDGDGPKREQIVCDCGYSKNKIKTQTTTAPQSVPVCVVLSNKFN